MNWIRFALVVIGTGILSSLTDCIKLAVEMGNESCAIALTSPLPFLTCGIFVFVIVRLGLHSVTDARCSRDWLVPSLVRVTLSSGDVLSVLRVLDCSSSH
jgi:hypothetical protein